MNGYGKIKYLQNNNSYAGEFFENYFNGFGIFTFYDGNQYEGDSKMVIKKGQEYLNFIGEMYLKENSMMIKGMELEHIYQ